jgi:hypothetical protein
VLQTTQGFRGNVSYRRETLNIPCKNPEKHSDMIFRGECLICHEKWLETLPWHVPFHKRGMDEEAALFEVLKIGEEDRKLLRRKRRFTCTIRDCFDGEQGPEWGGVAYEMFGVEIGELPNPDEYPFRRIVRKGEPNLVIVHLRSRFCFEPPNEGWPLYLEVQWRGLGETYVSIEGLDPDPDLNIGPKDINRTWRLYGFLFDKELDAEQTQALQVSSSVRQAATYAVRSIYNGDWRSQEIKNMWADEEVLKSFARKVDELWPIWTTIKGMADPCESKAAQDEWLSAMMSERQVVIDFIAKYPKLTKEILRRAVDTSLKPVDREPRQLTYFHAALEVEVSINGEKVNIIEAYSTYEDIQLSSSSLGRYYRKGKTLLLRPEQA